MFRERKYEGAWESLVMSLERESEAWWVVMEELDLEDNSLINPRAS
jgi:hypothetical protein